MVRILPAWILFILAVLWPTVALLTRILLDGHPPATGFTFTQRQLVLFQRSLWLSAISAVLCVLIALPAALVIGNTQRKAYRSVIIAMLAALLICPPIVYAFGWERLLPAGFHPFARCILVWIFWAWPIPAMIIGAGWSRTGKSACEAARLDTSIVRSFSYVALSTLRTHISLCFILVFVLFLTNYDVPHACGIIVYTTELLGWASNSNHIIDTAWPAILPVVVILLTLVGMSYFWRRKSITDATDTMMVNQTGQSSVALWIVLAGFTVSWVLPVGVLISKLNSVDVVWQAFRTYSTDLIWTLTAAMAAGGLAILMGLGWMESPRSRTVLFWWALTLGIMPGALVGQSLIAAYNHSISAALFDHWPIIVLSHLSRFGWIGFATVLLAVRQSKSDIQAQAQTDGANETSYMVTILLPSSWPVLLSGACLVAALSVGDAAGTSLVRVPGFSPISLIIIEKFHRFEDGMLISLSLFLVIACLSAVWLLSWALHRSQTR